ncbi:MAG: hypothetical protein WD048_11795 [Chitinophagales bacterium]
MRSNNYEPGIFKVYKGFEKVDTLITYNTYVTDESGIYKFNRLISDSLSKYFNISANEMEHSELGETLKWGHEDIKEIYQQFGQLRMQVFQSKNKDRLNNTKTKDTHNWDTEFPITVKHLYHSPAESRSNWSELILTYLEKPFNRDGFRSIPFDTVKSNRPKVLLLGDSFVYGMSAEPYFNSFSDILLARGYIVYNTGISGTDPAQYAAVAKKYIPLLNPDIVILNFYQGNDLMPFSRKVASGRTHEHHTNAGFIFSYPKGEYLNPEEAYNYYRSIVSIPDTEKNTFNKICSKSVILSLLWGLLYELDIVDHNEHTRYTELNLNSTKYEKSIITAPYVSGIQKVCNETNTPLINIVIPEKNYINIFGYYLGYTSLSEKVLDKLFSKKKYYYPEALFTNSDYSGSHFNNKGSLRYANYLDSLIKQHLSLNTATENLN